MSPWWSQEWIGRWGPPLFHAIFWPLTVLGAMAAWSPRRPAQAPERSARRARISLSNGLALGVALIAAGMAALAMGQPGYVWDRLVVFGGILITVHAALFVAMERARRTATQKGGVS